MKNTAPGTVFAVFGAALIVTMLVQSSPLVTRDTTQTRQSGENKENVTEKLQMRGGGEDSLAQLTKLGQEQEQKGNQAAAERSYREAVIIMAEPASQCN